MKGMQELNMEQLENINGGNWEGIVEGACGIIAGGAAIIAAPEVTIPLAIGALASGVGGAVQVGSNL